MVHLGQLGRLRKISPGSGSAWRNVCKRNFFIEASTEEIVTTKLGDSDSGIVIASLNRPESRNAIGQNMLSKLKNLTEALSDNSSARVLLITSCVPGIFCAGADLKERRRMSVSEAHKFVNSLRSAFTNIEMLPIPTISVIEGVALGGGLELALSCDIRVCGGDAIFGMPETSLAIIPGAGGTQRLPRLIGKSRAKELIFTARRVDAQEAESYGLVEYVVPAGEAYEKSLQIARAIIQQGPLAVRMAKFAIDCGTEVNVSSAMAIEENCYARVLQSKDRLEGLEAFAKKRPPIYRGE